jgi:hypothetical protein
VRSLYRALSAETLRLKRTLALAMVVVAPLFVVVVYALLLQQTAASRSLDGVPWSDLLGGTTELWFLLMLPLYVALQTALLAHIEHTQQTWKHTFALPIPRWAVYCAKFLMALALLAVSSVVLGVGAIPAGASLRAVDPSIGLAGPLPWGESMHLAMQVFLISWLLVALHGWVALRWSSVVVALGFGIVGMVAGALSRESPRWSPWIPWALPQSVIAGEPSRLWLALGLGALGGCAVMALAVWDLSRREVGHG